MTNTIISYIYIRVYIVNDKKEVGLHVLQTEIEIFILMCVRHS